MNVKSKSRKIFEIFNYTAFSIFTISIIFPFISAIAISFSDYDSVFYGKVSLWPMGFNTNSYKVILTNMYFLITFLNTVVLTVINTCLVIILSLTAGYVLANKHLIGGKVLIYIILIPMFFAGGLIPFYLTVNALQLNNTYWALILPSIVNIFYIIIFRNSIANVPAELAESAEMDGASDLVILFRIIFPVISPMVAAFVIFSAVTYWNEWYNVLLFIADSKRWTLQFWLRELLVSHSLKDSPLNPYRLDPSLLKIYPKSQEMAATIITIIPIALVYPFLQKYFIHGIIVGAVKG